MTKNEMISIENNLKTQHTLHISNTQNIISHSFFRIDSPFMCRPIYGFDFIFEWNFFSVVGSADGLS